VWRGARRGAACATSQRDGVLVQLVLLNPDLKMNNSIF
jgi:hypothetical protein